jgi:NADH dehydrogenase FAD-containing subunit
LNTFDQFVMKTIVILGGGWGGLGVAHKLLKRTTETRIVLISKSSHAYWNLAAPRGFLPDGFTDKEIFFPITPAFEQYAERAEIVIGAAKELNVASNAVKVSTKTGTQTFKYDFLVIATGSHYKSNLPWKIVDDYETTIKALADVRSKIDAAKSIVLAGSGPTGVETITELAHRYGKEKEIIHVLGSDRPLPLSRSGVRAAAEVAEVALGIKLIKDVMVTAATQKGKKTELTLSNGEKLLTDFYLPAAGVIPNSDFLPKSILDQSSHVIVDDHLLVTGTTNIYALGDVANIEAPTLMFTEYQITYLFTELEAVLKDGKNPKAYSTSHFDMGAVALGPDWGTGNVGWFTVPSMVIAFAKSKHLMLPTAAPWVAGVGMPHGAF